MLDRMFNMAPFPRVKNRIELIASALFEQMEIDSQEYWYELREIFALFQNAINNE